MDAAFTWGLGSAASPAMVRGAVLDGIPKSMLIGLTISGSPVDS